MADIPGDTSTTSVLAVGSTVTGTLETLGDHDWYRITLSAGQSISVSLNGISFPDTYLYIRDASGNLLYSNDDISSSNQNSQVAFTATYSGTFYIDVGAWNEAATGTYQVSVSTYTPPPVATNDQIAAQLVSGYWGGDSHHFAATQGGTITVNISTLNAGEQALARAALAEWTDIIGVNFREVTTAAQIRFDNTEQTAGTPIAATSANWSNGIETSAHVQISSSWVNRYGTSLYSYSLQTYVHEIGHALGLGHAGDYNNTARYPFDALFQNDSWATSIMSYFDQNENTYFAGQGFTTEYAVTPMAADILAMQQLYGLSTTTRTTDSTYGFNSNVGGVYDANLYPRAAYTIFDSGGNDTLDFSGASANQTINLNPETFSSVDGRVGNLSIARGVVIENAFGGIGADTIIGNSSNNVLRGGGAADTLTGGGGNDTFLDTMAAHNGDRITDFSAGDSIVFSDATLSGFTFSLSGNTLTYSGGSVTFGAGLSGTLVASSAPSGGVQLTLATSTTLISRAMHSDFNGDRRADVLLVSDSGTVIDWLGASNGAFFSNHANTTLSLPVGWRVAGTGDFDADGRADLVLRNDNGSITEWLGQANGSFTWNSAATYSLNASWNVSGTGDFNGDGRSDILLVNLNGTVIDWLGQAGGTFLSNHAVATYALPPGWGVDGVGDFNGDGNSDVLLRNANGSITEWLGRSDGGFNWNSSTTYNPTTSLHVAGVGDFNGDGRSDLLMFNDNGSVTDWLGQADGTFFSNNATATYALPAGWSVAQVGNFNGDAFDDILLRNTDGSITEWTGQPGGTLAWNSIASYSLSNVWQVVPHDTLI